MKNRIGFLILLFTSLLGNDQVLAQLLTKEEAKVDSLISSGIDSRLIVPEHSQLNDSRWVYKDELGIRTLDFSSNGKFKLKNDGGMGLYSSAKGSWYIYDRYVVLEVNDKKVPMYYLSYENKIFMLDPQSIDVMRQLIIGFVQKDQLLVGLSEETIFGFLIGFNRDDQ